MATSLRALTPACGYLRVSTDSQAEHGYGLDVQRQRIEEFCRRERLPLVAVFADPGVPGATPLVERPGLSAALRAIEEERVEVLVVARFDRLARDTLQALLIEDAFRRGGGTILYAEGLNGDDDGLAFMRTVMHAMSQEQKRQLVARLKAAREAKAAQGGYAGGRPPFGYRTQEGALVPDPEQAEIVRWIFERVARDGWTIRRISAALDEQERLDRRWYPTDVARILHREDYKRGTKRIVDPRLWNRAQESLSDRERQRTRP